MLKIESPKGIKLLDQIDFAKYENLHLMVARDDLYTNLTDPLDIIAETRHMIDLDPQTIVASRILTSLIGAKKPSLGDISDLTLLKESCCKRIMLCDELCQSAAFTVAMQYLERW